MTDFENILRSAKVSRSLYSEQLVHVLNKVVTPEEPALPLLRSTEDAITGHLGNYFRVAPEQQTGLGAVAENGQLFNGMNHPTGFILPVRSVHDDPPSR